MTTDTQDTPQDAERLRRWRLVLGGADGDGTGQGLSGDDAAMDAALGALYNPDGRGGLGGRGGGEKDNRNVGMGASSPSVSRWLGDIRTYFPASVVRVMQRDALERLNLRQMLLEPEMLANVEPDVHLVATLISLKGVIPAKTRDTARQVVRRVVEDLERRLANPLTQAVTGSLNRATRNRRPRHNEIDWNRTIRANLKHYQAEYKSIIPETRIGYGRKRSALRDVILCVDQSGSMASSIVYAGVFGAVLASLPALKTSVVVYDTSVVDLTEDLHDPVDLLFGVQLGGGNDTPRALAYCQGLIRNPKDSILILLTDLYEGGGSADMIKRLAAFAASGVQVIVLLALSDDGAPSYEHTNAQALAALGIPVFACTPDQFPALMGAALSRQDIAQWAAKQEIVTARAGH